MQAGQSLVSEVQVAIRSEEQIVDAFEARPLCIEQKRRDFPVDRIEQHDAVLVVGDEGAAVAMELQAVGPAVVLGDDVEDAIAGHLENAPVLDVDAP